MPTNNKINSMTPKGSDFDMKITSSNISKFVISQTLILWNFVGNGPHLATTCTYPTIGMPLLIPTWKTSLLQILWNYMVFNRTNSNMHIWSAMPKYYETHIWEPVV
jgi:hypothetical protein